MSYRVFSLIDGEIELQRGQVTPSITQLVLAELEFKPR